MNFLTRCGLVLIVASLTFNAWAAELETEEQKLGYIIGMDIGNSLRDQGADIDLDALIEAIHNLEAAENNPQPHENTSHVALITSQAELANHQTQSKKKKAPKGKSDANIDKSLGDAVATGKRKYKKR